MRKRIRYAVWLPLVHFLMMAPLISIEEAKGWQYLSLEQRIEDYDRAHPEERVLAKDAAPQVGWDPYYEYRPSISVHAMYTVEFPAAFLFSWCGHPPAGFFMSPSKAVWCQLFGFLRVRTRVVVLDLILVVGIYLQWWIVGRRLDGPNVQGKSKGLLQPTALGITLAGLIAAFLSQGPAKLELVSVLACFMALLGWIVLILKTATTVGRMACQSLRGESPAV